MAPKAEKTRKSAQALKATKAQHKKQIPFKKRKISSSSSASSKVTLKLLIDTKTNKVLFAEANKEFVDFLFHILSLPIGTVIKLLKKTSVVGSLGKLYKSIKNLSDSYMQTNRSKDSVLNPKTFNYGTNPPLLLPNSDTPMAQNFYRCSYNSCSVSDDPTAVCPKCRAQINYPVTYVSGDAAVKVAEEGGGFVKGVVTYMVMDDLEVKPMSTISSITMLNRFNVKELGSLEEKVVSLGMKEGLKLLKASLHSKNVLTSVFLA